MQLSILADEYYESIHALNKHLNKLQISLNNTNNLETKRKIRDKIVAHESVLRQNTVTYQQLKNYYKKDIS